MNFILKKKRKLSIESLTNNANDEMQKSFIKTAGPTSKLPRVDSYLFETGLNVQLIDKNDKKLVKLNLNQKPKEDSNNMHIKPMQQHRSQQKLMQYSNNFVEFDDLPSESDISSGTTVVLSNNLINVKTIQNKAIKICYKCNRCDQFFNSESILKDHQLNNCLNLNDDIVNIDSDCSTPNKNAAESNNCLSFDEKSNESISSDHLDDLSPSSSPAKVKTSSKKRVFICNECGRQYCTQNELNKHMIQSHESQKPFDCSMCEMKFNELSSKKRHEKEHAGYKPFRCYICSFEFTRASNLRSHILKVHPGDIGKSVVIAKTIDNKLKFEFNIGKIFFFSIQ